MFKLIALDMDGTLLNSQKAISPRTKAVITQARAAGVKVVLASGRPIEGMQDKLNELGIAGDNEFVLSYNGSLVKELGSNQIIQQYIIDGRSAKQIAKLADELGVYTHAFSQIHGLITPKHNEYTDIEAKINGLSVTEMDFSTLEDDHPIIKTMIVAAPETLTATIQQLPAELHEQFTIVQSAPYFLEFLNPSSNKGAGVQAIAEHLGISAQEVICMGDAENDHHMLRYAGLGIAMANAMEETKTIADYITLSNDEDGVAAAIEKFVLNA